MIMKKILLHTLATALALFNGAFAQVFPKTYTTNPCVNCAPPGYSVVSGGPVALSNMVGLGGSPIKPWVNGISNPPSTYKAIDQNENSVFLTLRHSTIQKDKVKANVSGFEIGNEYTFRYYVMTSRAQLNGSNSNYAASATVEIQTGNFTPVASKTTIFTPGINVNTWVEQTIKFTAPATDLVFYLSGLSNPQELAYVNFDIYSKPFDCVIPGGQVQLFHSNLDTPFACAKTNLYNQIKSVTPSGSIPVWGINPSSSYPQMTEAEAKAAGPRAAGEYYYAFYKTPGGCYNADLSTTKVSFISNPTQVSLKSHLKTVNCINQSTADLTSELNPSSYKVRWFNNDKHQGIPLDNPSAAPVGDYFAFYYDPVNLCYSTDKATIDAAFSVVGSTMCCNDPNDPTNQITLTSDAVKIVAPAQTYDITTLIPANYNLPPGVIFEWYTNANHSGSPIADPKKVGAGKYYIFAHDTTNGCFNVPYSKSSVTVSKTCNAGTTPVAIINNSNFLYCEVGEPIINLSDYVIGQAPAGTIVLWYNNSDHTGSPVTTGSVGNLYYAFYFDAANNCYNQDVSTAQLTFNISPQVPITCIYEDGCELSNGCPNEGVNLNSFHNFSPPVGAELRWFNNTTHSGQQVSDPTKVKEEGTYYAFYYHTTKNCYNRKEVYAYEEGGKGIAVVNEACNTDPQLSLRVALQGAIQTVPSDDIMRNNLQVYPGSAGLLPTSTPYGGSETSPEINDAAKLGSVVDWVKVEIRDAVNPSVLLETKSLLLSGSGFVMNVDGTAQPYFTSQPKPVRIVVKHRNHLAVVSNPIQNFTSGVIDYDFTTAPTQAANDFGDPAQMVQKNGIWCMQSGDLNSSQDFVVDGSDGAYFKAQFKGGVFDAYDRADTTMDGVVDGLDGSLFKTNFLMGLYSTITNY
jgi:hypothetical protein